MRNEIDTTATQSINTQIRTAIHQIEAPLIKVAGRAEHANQWRNKQIWVRILDAVCPVRR